MSEFLSSSSTRYQMRHSELVKVTDCACLSYQVTYECTTVGAGATIWNWTVFEDGCVIALLHSYFEDGTANEMCSTISNEAVVGRGLRVV